MLQKQVAELNGINPSTLGSYERGEAFPSLNRAHTLCTFYDAPLEFLFSGQGLNRTLNSKLGTLAQRK